MTPEPQNDETPEDHADPAAETLDVIKQMTQDLQEMRSTIATVKQAVKDQCAWEEGVAQILTQQTQVSLEIASILRKTAQSQGLHLDAIRVQLNHLVTLADQAAPLMSSPVGKAATALGGFLGGRRS